MKCQKCKAEGTTVRCEVCERFLCVFCYIAHVKDVGVKDFKCRKYCNREARRKTREETKKRNRYLEWCFAMIFYQM